VKPGLPGRSSRPLPSAREIGERLRIVERGNRLFRRTTLAEVERERDPFRLLVACVISLRTKDAVTAQASERLFAVAPDPKSMAALDEEVVAKAIYPAGFYRTKAKQIVAIAKAVDGAEGVPASLDGLLALPGVGRKTANLVLGLGFGIPAICVDTHVHRISNRWAWVSTRNPEETESELRELLPRRWWIPVNDLLVTFGQNLCLPVSPLCSRCPLEASCAKCGVGIRR
jgi:endonuclease-3